MIATHLKRRTPYHLVRWTLALLFLAAGALKLADPAAFAVVISDFGILDERLIPALTVALPALEILAALGLLLDLRGSLAVVAALLAIFIAILAWAIHLGLDIDCGCYGPADPESRAYDSLRTSLARDIAMLAGVGYLYWWRAVTGHAPRRLFPQRFPLETSKETNQ